eukprot:TRINITY_DN7887_c0_g2_i1.p1 TRINITY_DN7887_c0_g2~~TRINITY_DN7887_c0_g2_i1.p1  ORF type:complete len:524 (-),score=104.10 TRINITY_DN7887_c0_g2_i1:90-1541(-)
MTDEISETDIAELQAFLGLTTSGAETSPTPPPPPGFEDGPGESAEPRKPVAAAASSSKSHGLVNESDDNKVLVTFDDPTAPLLGVSSWDELDLPQAILDGIHEMGFVKPSKIQEWTLPIARAGGNVVAQAKNGSGKTAAFSIAMLMAVNPADRWPQAICICPTRELADQNLTVLRNLGKFTNFEYFLAVPQGERPPRKVEAQIIVGTPGKLQDLIKKRVIDSRWSKVLVLDEADIMVDSEQSMGAQVLSTRQLLAEELQVLLFSATWPEHVEQFARAMVPKANRITVEKEDLTLNTIMQTFIDVGSDASRKSEQLSNIYGALNIGQSIIFVNTRTGGFELAQLMQREGHSVSLICGTQKSGPEQLPLEQRDQIMAEFRTGVTKVLIATDVLSRGIDVPAVTLVVNYDLPLEVYQRRSNPKADFETYLHRIGRTGRFGLRGVALNLVTSSERPILDSIRDHYACTFTELTGDCEEVESLLRALR